MPCVEVNARALIDDLVILNTGAIIEHGVLGPSSHAVPRVSYGRQRRAWGSGLLGKSTP